MKRKPDDWADKTARDLFERFDCFGEAFHGMARDATIGELAILFRAAEKRGFKRAVKLLHGETSKLAVSWPTVAENLKWNQVANWLEEQGRK